VRTRVRPTYVLYISMACWILVALMIATRVRKREEGRMRREIWKPRE